MEPGGDSESAPQHAAASGGADRGRGREAWVRSYLDRLAERASGVSMPAVTPMPPRELSGADDPFESVAPFEAQSPPSLTMRALQPASDRAAPPELAAIRPAPPEVAP